MEEKERASVSQTTERLGKVADELRTQAFSMQQRLGTWLVVGNVGSIALLANLYARRNDVRFDDIIPSGIVFTVGASSAFLGIYLSTLFAIFVSNLVMGREMAMRNFVLHEGYVEDFKNEFTESLESVQGVRDALVGLEAARDEIAEYVQSPPKYILVQKAVGFAGFTLLLISTVCFPLGMYVAAKAFES